MSLITVDYDEGMADGRLAACLREMADRLDPPQRAVAEPTRVLPAGLRVENSSAGHLAVCTACGWRSGPHTPRQVATDRARAHICYRSGR